MRSNSSFWRASEGWDTHARAAFMRCRRVVRAVTVIALLFVAPAVLPQACETPVTVIPANPDSGTPVTLTFLGYIESCSSLTYAVTGNVVRIEHTWQCLFTETHAQRQLAIGPLPAGDYEVRFVRTLDDPLSDSILCGAFSVAPATAGAAVPAVSRTLLVVLGLVLSMVALNAVRRLL
jgi:hypothetical protein